MNVQKRHLSILIFLSTLLPSIVSANTWEFEKISKEIMLEKCALWFDALSRNDEKNFGELLPSGSCR